LVSKCRFRAHRLLLLENQVWLWPNLASLGAGSISIRVMAWAWHWQTRLPPMPKLVLMALADEANDNCFCFPSHRRLAWKCTISERTVRRMVGLLASQRYLSIEPRFAKDRSRTSNGYRLSFAHPPDKLTRGWSALTRAPWPAVTRARGQRRPGVWTAVSG